MPKQLYKIVQFHGGLNSNSDARDIADNELSEATDVMVDELGKIRMMGGVAAHVSGSPEDDQATGWTGTLISGYGLFYFSHDRTGAEDKGSSEAITGDDYLAIYDGNDGQVWIYSRVANVWNDDVAGSPDNRGVIDIGSSNTTTAQVNYYTVDGALRICDGLHTNSNTPQWYGYISRSHFAINRSTPPGAGSEITTYSKWVTGNQQMPAPTKGLLGQENTAGNQTHGVISGGTSDTALVDAGAFATFTDADDFVDNDYIAVNQSYSKYATITARTDANTLTTDSIPEDWNSGNSWSIMPPIGTGFTLWFKWWAATKDEDWGPSDVYEVAASFIYDGNQETDLYYYNHTVTSTADFYLNLRADCLGDFNPRYTDFMIYYRKEGEIDWLFLAEISLSDGMRLGKGSVYAGWGGGTESNNGTDIDSHFTQIQIHSPPTLLTYDIKSGSTLDNRLTSVTYKTAVVSNRRAYIGNVQYTDFNSIVHTKGDAVIKSTVNQFDTFGLNGLLEASVNDGDNIIKLEAYADRLLIFKKNKLELLNISQEVEFLEDTFRHKGVSHPAATCKTDFGIAWVNRQGCYLYDGQKVNNLLEKGGRQIIKESDWDGFTTDNSIIGYVPKKRQIIVLKDCSASNDGDIYLFDMVTQSWVNGLSKFTDDKIQTNLVTDWNGDLVHAHTSNTGTVVKWDDAGDDSTAFVIATKDIDFGQPGQKKKIYKVYVTYTGVSSLSVNVDYQINGDNGWNGFSSGEPLTASSGQNEAILTLSTPVECYSFQLRFSGTGKTAFEINDATIVFRLKGMR